MQETYCLVYSYIQLQYTQLDFLKTTSHSSICFALDKNAPNILILKRKINNIINFSYNYNYLASTLDTLVLFTIEWDVPHFIVYSNFPIEINTNSFINPLSFLFCSRFLLALQFVLQGFYLF